MSTYRFGRHSLHLSNADKVLYPHDGITKADVLEYYVAVADVILPYLRDRPLTVQRYPDGIANEGFFQKRAQDHFPDWVETVTVETADGSMEQPLCGNAATLAFLADQAAIALHVTSSRVDRLDHPDLLVFDLDPTGDDFEPVRVAARWLRELLDKLGLVPFVKTTGSRGLHVVCPLDRSRPFDDVRAFARDVADLLARRHDEVLTTEVRKHSRRGRLYLDVGRNSYGQTAVAPYSLRALDGAPVAAPLEWDELKDPALGPRTYTLGNIRWRLAQRGDPWKGMMRRARSLDKPRERLRRMVDQA
ncbi:MAG: non-homologous end-joining DNA ligase [Dehalococcoidia bacterium]